MAQAEVAVEIPLTAGQIAHYREHGYVKLKNMLSAEALAHYGPEITRLVKELNTQSVPLEQRDTYSKAFLQIQNLWTHSETVREFAFGKRLGRIAAELMGISGVRMYHDQALYKEPGGGVTPAKPREVMTIIYMDEDMHLIEPKTRAHRADWEKWCTGAKVGEIIDTPLNPVIWRGRG